MRELLGAIVTAGFVAVFVYMMNYIADPKFNGNGWAYTWIVLAVLIYAALMTYWEYIFPGAE
jgi:hypothetical protein